MFGGSRDSRGFPIGDVGLSALQVTYWVILGEVSRIWHQHHELGIRGTRHPIPCRITAVSYRPASTTPPPPPRFSI